MTGRGNRGFVRAGIALLALLALAMLVPAAQPAPSRDPGTRLKILAASQRTLLRTHVVRVSVRVRRAAVVRVGVTGSPVKRLRFRRAGTKTVSLTLGIGLRRTLARCGPHRIVVRAGRARATRVATADPARCPHKVSPTRAPAAAAAAPANGSVAATAADPPSPHGACDPIDPAVCLQPWPNDYFTVADSSTATGRRLSLDLQSMPRNRNSSPIDPTDMNRADGFSPGSAIITRVPGLDSVQAMERTGAVPITDMARYADADQPIVVIDAATGQRHPVWSEIDSSVGADKDRNVIVRPTVNFLEGHRYIVALRNLRKADGSLIPAPDSFKLYRDGVKSSDAAVEARRPHIEALLNRLGKAGIARGDLYLTWDFTVASQNSLTGRMLSIRDRAFADLGDTNLADLKPDGDSPEFEVDQVDEDPFGTNHKIARRVEGTVKVPCYLNAPGCPAGSTFQLDPRDGTPVQIPGNTTDARFTCFVPRSALTPGNNARPSLYGHGLLGSRSELGQEQLKNLAGDYNFVFCATDWIGMACADVPLDTPPTPEDETYPGVLASWIQATMQEQADRQGDDGGPSIYPPNCDLPVTLAILNDASLFPKLADRVQQGMLNFMFLGRAMLKGFNSDPAFQRDDAGHTGVIDTTRLFYDGNSQGGIIGGALAAVEPDLDRASIGVPGMNYSTLLTRSVDFDSYATGEFVDGANTPFGMYDAYPNELERPLLMGLIQLLWDRAEANGYAQHITTDPLPNTPVHHVLMSVALGDHQVANVAAETEARTMGAAARTPYVDPGRSPYSTNAPFGLGPIGFFPYDGSAITMWDSGPIRQDPDDPTKTLGTDVPVTTNKPPRAGNDPHELPRSTPADRAMKSAFLSVGGRVIDTCAGGPCHSVPRR